MSEPEVIVRREGGLGRLTLNRPAALGALTTVMCELMTEALLAWREDAGVHAVLIDHAGERGFCAGGDIRTLAESAAGDGSVARRFFFTEYRLNHLMKVYGKPIVSVMDGVTMGGGVGVSWAATHQVATERTTFAMPETGIGLFPDVGAGWFLPRLPGRSGLWLALTGARLKAADCLALGLASHFMPSADVAAFKQALAAEPGRLADVLAAHVQDPGPPPVAALRADIDRLFDHERVEDVVEALSADGGEWAKAQAATIAVKSPLSLKVSAREYRDGGRLGDFADDMAMEYRIACRIGLGRDFIEGVRAVIVDKDNAPVWAPATLEEVSDAMLDDVFAPLPAGEEWSPLPQLARNSDD